MLEFKTDLVIVAPPATVLDAFFDPHALAVWWRAKRSVCVPRPLGSDAIEWEPTEWRDDVLGRLGGTLHGTVGEQGTGCRGKRKRTPPTSPQYPVPCTLQIP